MDHHKMVDKVRRVLGQVQSKEMLKVKLDALDAEMKQYMIVAEKKYRKVKSGRIPFSPEASKWIRISQVYRSLLRLHAVKVRNVGNLKRATRRCGIEQPMKMPLAEIQARGSKYLCKKCNFFKKHRHRYRRRHLRTRLERAQQERDREAETRILNIIRREKNRSYWRIINFGTKKRKRRSVRVVTEDLGGGVTREHNDQTQVEAAIFSNIQDQRFYPAENAPICRGRLRGEFGYLANTLAGDDALGGTYDYSADFHPVTKELLEECARIRAQVPENSVCDFLGCREWQRQWLKVKEKTSLSVSTLYFGHYIAGAKSDMISYVHSFKTPMSLKHGTLLDG